MPDKDEPTVDEKLYNFLKERLSPQDLGTARALVVNYCEQKHEKELKAARQQAKEEGAREAILKLVDFAIDHNYISTKSEVKIIWEEIDECISTQQKTDS